MPEEECKDGIGDSGYADDQLLIGQDYEGSEYMTRKLIDEYELWGLKLNAKKKKLNVWP